MPYEELTYKHLNNLRDEIRAQMSAKGLDDTKSASNSLEIEGNKLTGNDYIYFLDKGRAPGKFPPAASLRDWVRNKLGIEGSEAKQVAFLVGRKISSQGTEIYRDKTKGLQLDDLVNDMLNELEKELPEVAAVEVLKWL